MRASYVLFAVLISWSRLAAAGTAARVGVGTGNLQFDFLYSDYHTEPLVVQRYAAEVGESDLLVALYLAQVTGAGLDVIVNWRRSGMSWDRITRSCHRDGRIYYVELPPEVTSPPYGRAHGYWKRHPRRDLALTDTEIRELVLVRALSAHARLSPAEVVRMRTRGESPRAIAVARRERARRDGGPQTASTLGGGAHEGDPGRTQSQSSESKGEPGGPGIDPAKNKDELGKKRH
jgi:hypothetical protein